MRNYLKTSLVFAQTQLKRSFRDPMTLLVLFAIPLLLLIVFGSFLRDTSNISIKVAVVNNSSEKFAEDFNNTLKNIDVLKLPEENLNLDEAKQQMNNGDIDGIIELPKEFGKNNTNNIPAGSLKIYYDATDSQTSDIVSSIMRGVVDESNKQLTDISLPLNIEREAVNVTKISAIDTVFSMFTGLAIMMVGIFGVASVIPYDKKGGYLKRLRATPMRPGQFIIGTMLNYALIGLFVVAVMTVLAVFMFNLEIRGDLINYALFILISLIMMLGFGLAIGSIAKNTTQADVWGQVVFLSSLALGGVWFPKALMPEFLQGIVSFMPLTPIIEGIKAITVESASLLSLGPELAVIAGWAIVTYAIGIKLFRWE